MERYNSKYDSIGDFNQGVAIVIKNGLYGAIVMGGHEIITPSYNYITPFVNGFAQAIRHNKCIIIDLSGREQNMLGNIKTLESDCYDGIRDFKCGLACVVKDGKWGVVDSNFKEIIPLKFSYISDFVAGTAIFNDGYQWGYINSLGRITTCPSRPILESDGNLVLSLELPTSQFADIESTDNKIPLKRVNVRINNSGQILVYNKTSLVALPHIYVNARNFKCGLSCVQDRKGYWGAIDTNGNIVVQPQYLVIQDFSENLSFAKSEDKKIYILNSKGERVKEFDFLFVPSPFTNGYSLFYKNGKWGIMNNTGEILLRPLANRIVISEQPCIFTLYNKHNKIGYFNAENRRLILPLYDKIINIEENGALVAISDFGTFRIDCESKPIISNETNNQVLPEWCVGAIALNERYYKVISDSDNVGIISKEGKEIISPSYSKIALCSDNFYVQKGQYWGIVNENGKVLLPIQFQELKPFTHGIFFKEYGEWGVMNQNFEVIHNAEFDLITEIEGGFFKTQKKKVDVNNIEEYTTYELNGILDEYGHEKLQAIYTKIENTSLGNRGLITCEKLHGIIDNNYNIIAKPIYYSILNFKGGRAIAEKKDNILSFYSKIGTLDLNGNFEEKSIDELLNYPINTIIEDLSDFHIVTVLKNNYKIIQLKTSEYKNQLCGIIDIENKVVCPIIYNSICLTDTGNYKVCIDRMYGLLDEKFKILIPPKYGDLFESNNILIVYKTPSYFSSLDNNVGLISQSGTNILPFSYSSIKYAAHNLFWIYTDSNQKIGLADSNGKILISPQYGKVEPFINGFSMVNKGTWYESSEYNNEDQNNNKVLTYHEGYWGAINTDGVAVIPPIYTKIHFNTESQTFEVEKSNYSGHLDINGNLVIRSITGQYILASTKYDWQEDFDTNNLSVVYFKGQKGYLNSNMNLVITIVSNGLESYVEIPPSYDWAEHLILDFIKVEKNGKLGIIDKNLKNIIDVTFDRISLIQDKESFVIVCEKKEEHSPTYLHVNCNSIYDKQGNDILSEATDYIQDLGFGLYTIKGKDDKFLIYNTEGNMLFNESYDKVYPFGIFKISESDWGERIEKIRDDNFAVVVKDKLYGAIFNDGVTIIPCKYKSLNNTDYELFHAIGSIADLNNKSTISNSIKRFPDSLSQWSQKDIRSFLNNSVHSSNICSLNWKEQKYEFYKMINDNLFIVTKDNLYGCINTVGKIIIPIEYVSLEGDGNLFVAYRKNAQTGWYESGVLNFNHIVIPFDKKYETLVIKSNFILYKSQSKWGAYTLFGNLIFEAQYDEVNQISENLLKVGRKENFYNSYLRWGIKDIYDNEILPIEYSSISDNLINDLIEVIKDQKIGYIRKDGNWVLEPRYESINLFEDGYAIVSKGINQYGVIDNNFKEIIPCVFYQIEYFQDLGLFKTGYGYKTKSGEFIADNNGCKILIPSKYTYCLDFINHVSITVYDLGHKRKYGLIDDCTNEIFPPIFDNLEYQDADVYKYELDIDYTNKKFGLLNTSGKILVPNIYDSISDFDNGLAYVSIKDKITEKLSCGFIDLNGKEILPISYELIGKRHGMYSIVMSNGIWEIFNRVDNTLVTVMDASCLGPCKDGICKVNEGGKWELNKVLGGKWGFVNILGEKIIPTIYDAAYDFSEGIAAVKFEGKVGFIDVSGKTIVPFIYDSVKSSFVNGKGSLIKDDNIFILNKKGEIINSYENDTNSFSDDYYDYDNDPSYSKYGGYNDYSDETIDDVFDGNPEMTWNID